MPYVTCVSPDQPQSSSPLLEFDPDSRGADEWSRLLGCCCLKNKQQKKHLQSPSSHVKATKATKIVLRKNFLQKQFIYFIFFWKSLKTPKKPFWKKIITFDRLNLRTATTTFHLRIFRNFRLRRLANGN